MATSLQQRFGPAPEALVELMRVDNEIEGIAERAYVPRIDQAFLRDLRLAIAGLPYEVRRAVDGKLAGVYLLSGFAGSGMAQQLFDEEGRVVGGVIVLDPLQFETRTANTWMQWKESQPFHDDRSGWRLRAEIAEAGDDDRVRAIQWTLLHEIGHVLAYGTDLLPPYGIAARSDPGDAAYPYLDLAWRVKAGAAPPDGTDHSYLPTGSEDFPGREHLGYYTYASQVPAADMPRLYEALHGTGLPTAYGATNPWDDFAEAFTSYVHVEMMRRPYVVRVYRGDTLVRTYRSCWEERRCESRRAFMRQALGMGK